MRQKFIAQARAQRLKTYDTHPRSFFVSTPPVIIGELNAENHYDTPMKTLQGVIRRKQGEVKKAYARAMRPLRGPETAKDRNTAYEVYARLLKEQAALELELAQLQKDKERVLKARERLRTWEMKTKKKT